jgi:hypothetical protein
MDMSEIVCMFWVLLAIMACFDVVFTKALWPDVHGAHELMTGLVPIVYLTLLITLLMINIPFASVHGVMAGSVIGFVAFAAMATSALLSRKGRRVWRYN